MIRKVLFLCLFVGCMMPAVLAADRPRAPLKSAWVEKALSGDAIQLKSGLKVRYIGVEAPSQASRSVNEALVGGKKIWLEWDYQLLDDNRHALAYVFLDDGTFVNQAMLKSGLARLRILPPNTKYSASLRQAELDARRNRRGLWKDARANPRLLSEYVGEINTKLYYFPTSPELERIPAANQITFHSRVEAKAAGYRPCPSCHESDAYNPNY